MGANNREPDNWHCDNFLINNLIDYFLQGISSLLMSVKEVDMFKHVYFFGLLLCLQLLKHVSAHGRLIEPPSRTSAWRFGFDTPTYYNDSETNCGGFQRHQEKNGGKCGICGDPWDEISPRQNGCWDRFQLI